MKFKFHADISFDAFNLDDALQQLEDHLSCTRLMVPDASPLEFVGTVSLDHDDEENVDA